MSTPAVPKAPRREFFPYMFPGFALLAAALIIVAVLPLEAKGIFLAAWLFCMFASDRRRRLVPLRRVAGESRWMTRVDAVTVQGPPSVVLDRARAALELVGAKRVVRKDALATVVGFLPATRKSLGQELSATVKSLDGMQSIVHCRCRPRFALTFLDGGAGEEGLRKLVSILSA